MTALNPRPAVATVAAHADFAAVLAQRLLEAAGPDPLALARALVLLPNRRAAAALTRAFLRLRDGLLLPRMIAVVDLDDADAPLADDPAIPPAVPAAERRFHLAGALLRRGVPPAAALTDAQSLGAALDTLALERRSARDLHALETGQLSAFWQQTLQHLALIADAWPAQLAAENRIDEAARRAALLDLTARRWSETGADGRLVVAAGIASAPPPVANLLRVVARLPRGQVVLPGLDPAMPPEAWASLDPADPSSAAHPQASLKALLEAMDVAPGEVALWDAPSPTAARAAAAARALDPAAFTAAWAPEGRSALADVPLIEAATPAEEALVIALALRRALETEGRTAALVTPDRALAARVVACLARFGIAADDSAGVPLAQTPPAAFIRLLAATAAEDFAPIPLLAVLKHPFAGAEDRAAHLAYVRALDLKLRGPAPRPGLAAIGLAADPAWWPRIAAALAPLQAPPQPLPDWIDLLISAAETLAGDRAWRRQDGRLLAETLEALRETAAPLGLVPARALPQVLATLFAEVAVRLNHGLHPRVAILGLLEARLQRADLMILGGLNEGAWPSPPSPDPWLPPAARRQLGLPPLERRIGLAAQDFLAALGAPAVLLTRSRRDATAPTSPSRFLLRLQAMAGDLSTDAQLLAVARALDAPTAPPRLAQRPAPIPPAAARPRRISVTDVDRLRTDPFSFYAARILRLRELEAVAADLSPARRGEALHKALELWTLSGAPPENLVPQAEAWFRREFAGQPRLAALWLPRLLNALRWAAAEFADSTHPARAEVRAEAELSGVTLTGRADHVATGADGLVILDYKSGALPTDKQIKAGYALQLPLLALLAERGALAAIPPAPTAALHYWRLSGGRSKPGECRDVLKALDKTGADAAARAAALFAETAAAFLHGAEPFTAKLRPEYAAQSRTYDQLARLEEWVDRLQPPPA